MTGVKLTEADLGQVFFARPAGRAFAKGEGPFPERHSKRVVAGLRWVAVVLGMAGAVATLVAAWMYFSRVSAHERLVASVRTIRAEVLGCDGRANRWERFRYTVNGTVYEPVYWDQLSWRVGTGNGLRACREGTVQLNYLADDPREWAIAPRLPIRERPGEDRVPDWLVAGGPLMLGIAGLYGILHLRCAARQRKEKRLSETGILLRGELVSIRNHWVQDLGTWVRLSYRFRDPGGQWRTGSVTQVGEMRVRPPAGTPMLVVYAGEDAYDAL